MKRVLLYIPIVLSLVVLGAHFMRYGYDVLVAGAVLMIALLFIRQLWVARLAQLVLALGALEWVYTLYGLIQLRTALDQPYARMAIILGTVAAVTLGSALLFQTKELKKLYKL